MICLSIRVATCRAFDGAETAIGKLKRAKKDHSKQKCIVMMHYRLTNQTLTVQAKKCGDQQSSKRFETQKSIRG